MSKSKMIVRTKFVDRACHWTVVICFFLVALSGISFFFPTLQWLTQTFGTPQMGRILHPFFGIAIFIALMFMFVRFVHHNIPDKKDIPWLKNIVEVLKGNEHKVADVGKYNAGQKMMFWSIMSMIFVLLVTGVIIWRPYFAQYFPMQVVRYSLLIHAAAGIILMHAILIHMYSQDSEISWVHWDNLPETANALREFTRHLIQLRATQPLLRRESWRDGLEIRWFNAGGGAQQSEQWDEGSTIGVCISRPDLQPEAGIWHDALLLFNPFEGSVPFRIPMWGEGGWVLELTTADNAQQGMRITEEMDFDLAGRSIVLFRRP